MMGKEERFELLKNDVDFPARVFDRMTTSELRQTLPEIAKAEGIPRGQFVSWFITKHRDKYDEALRVLTDELAFEAVKIADDADPEAVQKAKLRVDTRLRTAARWDRERYGEREPAQVAVIVPLGDIAREIRELESKLGLLPAAAQEKVINAIPAAAEPIEQEGAI